MIEPSDASSTERPKPLVWIECSTMPTFRGLCFRAFLVSGFKSLMFAMYRPEMKSRRRGLLPHPAAIATPLSYVHHGTTCWLRWFGLHGDQSPGGSRMVRTFVDVG